MTEIVAAHLERVARELIDDWDNERNCPDGHVHCGLNCLERRVAAALAACAREALEKAAQACDAVVKERRGSLGWYNAQRCADALRALERAVGEKGKS